MPGILDRYFIRELLVPFFIGLLIFTFLLLLDPLADHGERLIAKGVSWSVVGRVFVTLLPQALAVTIPIALLIALLVALGRFSADRETVAMQACGISVFRLLRPVLLVSTLCATATGYVMLVALPDANQAFREIVYGVVSARVGSEVKPRVFYEDFPNRVLYVRDLEQGGTGWRDVFLADTTRADEPVVYTARRGRMMVDRARRTVEIQFEDGAVHAAHVGDPAKYEVQRFERFNVRLDPESVFPRSDILKGDNEMSIPELRARREELRSQGLSEHGPIMALHRKFSIPVACFVFALIAVGLGTSTGRGSKLASFVPGIGVVFVYYVFEYLGRQMAKGQVVPAALATWAPNIILGACGVALLFWRARSADKPLRFALPRLWRSRPAGNGAEAAADGQAAASRPRVVVVIRVPQLRFPLQGIGLLDKYVARLFSRILVLAFFGMLGIFYISTFIDLSDKLFKGQTTLGMLAQYFYYATPQFVFFIIPLSVLISAMVTIGLLTKSSELVVMKACGLSLYRVSAPLLVLGVVGSMVMFLLQDSVLAYTNRRAESLRHVIRGGSPKTFDVVNRKWLVSRDGDIYNYLFYDPRAYELNGLSVFRFTPASGPSVAGRTYVSHARYVPNDGGGVWRGSEGWAREFAVDGTTRAFATFPGRALSLEPPDYFATETPDADLMSYVQLRGYIQDLRAGGVNVTPHRVQLHRKLAFPLVTLIMTLIAVPFATTTGRRGALYGVAVGIVLAVTYWIMTNAFGALGSAGALPAVLAAWAPNVIFGAGAAYMLLTVRT